jgi:hypothetical protein
LSTGSNFLLHLSKNKIFLNLVRFYGYKKRYDNKFSPLLLLLDPGWNSNKMPLFTVRRLMLQYKYRTVQRCIKKLFLFFLKTFGIQDDRVFNKDDVSKRVLTLAASSPAVAACREVAEGMEAVEGEEAATLASIITGLLIVFTASVKPPGGKKFIQFTKRSLLLCHANLCCN